MTVLVSITRAELESAGACTEGIDLYDACCRRFKGGVRKVKVDRWEPIHTIWLLRAYPSFWSWLVSKDLIPRANLYGADLSRANLYGAYRGTDPAPAGWLVRNGYLQKETKP